MPVRAQEAEKREKDDKRRTDKERFTEIAEMRRSTDDLLGKPADPATGTVFGEECIIIFVTDHKSMVAAGAMARGRG